MKKIAIYIGLMTFLLLVGCQSGSNGSVAAPTAIATPTVAPTATATPTVAPTATATPVNYRTFANSGNGVVFVLPQTWERKVDSSGLQIFWSNANLVISDVASSTNDLGAFVKNWLIDKPLFVEVDRTQKNNMEIITGSVGRAYRQFVFVLNAANRVTIFTFGANPDYLEEYVAVFEGIQDSIKIDASLLPHTPTPSPTMTPTSTPTPTPEYTHINGDQIPSKTAGGTNSCDQRFSATAFCIELLVYEGVTNDHVQKAVDGLVSIVGRYPVSEPELTVTWPEFGPNGGLQSYLGYVIWDPILSTKSDVLTDICQFRYVAAGLHVKQDKDICESRVSGGLESTVSGSANQSGAELQSNGYIINSSTALYSNPIQSSTAPARLLFGDPRKVTAHEYFHSYQDSHGVRIIGGSTPPTQVRKIGPIWLIEGSAEYAAVRVSSLEGWMNWETQMKERMNIAKDSLAAYPNKSIDDNSTPSQQENNNQESAALGHALTYELATWAVAYAISISSHDAVMVNYWDDLENYGYEESFRRNVGMNLQEFYISFGEFQKKSLDEQYSSISAQVSQ